MDWHIAGASCVIIHEQDVNDRPGTGGPGHNEVLGIVQGYNICCAEPDGIVLDDDTTVMVPERGNCKEHNIQWQVILLHPQPMNLKAWRQVCKEALKQWGLALTLVAAMDVDESSY